MDVLLGTTNPSKAAMFENWLAGEGIRFLTLREVSIPGEPEETRRDPGRKRPPEGGVLRAVRRLCDLQRFRAVSGRASHGGRPAARPACAHAAAARRTGWTMRK